MKILGVKIDNLTFGQALERACALLRSDGQKYIVTPNPEIIVLAQKDKKLREILNQYTSILHFAWMDILI